MSNNKGKRPFPGQEEDPYERLSRTIASNTKAAPSSDTATSTSGGGARVIRASGNNIVVNTVQKGNPIIQHIRNAAWEYGEIVCDYQVGATTGVLFLSLRYHQLHPEYIQGRIETLGSTYLLRILLVHCDVENHASALRELTLLSLGAKLTMIVAWKAEEAGKYLELFKTMEKKGPDMIKERVEKDHVSVMNAALTSIKGVNKADVLTLTTNFGSFKNIVQADTGDLVLLPGLGDKKVKRIREAFTAPLNANAAKKKKETSQAEINASIGNALN